MGCSANSKEYNEQNLEVEECEKLVGFGKHSALDIETTFRRFSSGLELNSNGIKKVCEILKLPHSEAGLFS